MSMDQPYQEQTHFQGLGGSFNVNKPIIAATLVIMAVGVIHAWTSNPPQGITRIVLGGYILMLILSVFDMIGGGLASLSRAIAMLAMVTVLLLEGIPILQQFGIITTGAGSESAAAKPKSTPPGVPPEGTPPGPK